MTQDLDDDREIAFEEFKVYVATLRGLISSSSAEPPALETTGTPPPPPPTLMRVRAAWAFDAVSVPDWATGRALSFEEGATIEVTAQSPGGGWWTGRRQGAAFLGVFPANYTHGIYEAPPPAPQAAPHWVT